MDGTERLERDVSCKTWALQCRCVQEEFVQIGADRDIQGQTMFDLAQFFALGGQIDLGQLFPMKPHISTWTNGPLRQKSVVVCGWVWVGVGGCVCVCFVSVWVLGSGYECGCWFQVIRLFISGCPGQPLRSTPEACGPLQLSHNDLRAVAWTWGHNSTRRPPQRKKKIEIGSGRGQKVRNFGPSTLRAATATLWAPFCPTPSSSCHRNFVAPDAKTSISVNQTARNPNWPRSNCRTCVVDLAEVVLGPGSTWLKWKNTLAQVEHWPK